jgi:FixJ family two-component response regulator
MAPSVKAGISPPKTTPSVLLVDDEPGMIEMASDVIRRGFDCKLHCARDVSEARAVLSSQSVNLLVTDLHLPDGDGMDLLAVLNASQPLAATVVITGDTSMSRAVGAMRAGAMDFLPKPFSAQDLIDRMRSALARNKTAVREARRITRLKLAVKRLNASRRTVSRKVDLLCNDLISAYSELSRQMDEVRLQEAFRKLMGQAQDLEQLLCHAMDWMLREIGYANVAIWLASEQQEFELGAYMKYTHAADTQLTTLMQQCLLPRLASEGMLRLSEDELESRLSPAEAAAFQGQGILGCNCTYLGEPLAALILFRDQKAPFTDQDALVIKSIAPIFSVALASIVRASQVEESEDTPFYNGDSEGPTRSDPRSEADWWKRGEPPPF